MGQLIKILNEIQIKKPNIIWDFKKYIPNFDPKKIRPEDIIIHLGDHRTCKVKDNFISSQNVLCITKYKWQEKFDKTPVYISHEYLIKVNNRKSK